MREGEREGGSDGGREGWRAGAREPGSQGGREAGREGYNIRMSLNKSVNTLCFLTRFNKTDKSHTTRGHRGISLIQSSVCLSLLK